MGTVPFTVVGPAPTNSLFVASTGKVGLRTATPGLDLHISTSDTPAQRLEQTNSGGFTAQTWDIGANEANFFVRDVTGGSRLPFRIRPGAPTSSVDINAAGNVGVGTASPGVKLHVFGAAAADTVTTIGPLAVAGDGLNIGHGGMSFGAGTSFLNAHSASGTGGKLLFLTETATRMTIDNPAMSALAWRRRCASTPPERFASQALRGAARASRATPAAICHAWFPRGSSRTSPANSPRM